MKIGLLITTFNRPSYLKRCLESLERADLSKIHEICNWDDASTNSETKRLINDYEASHGLLALMGNENNCGIKVSLQRGYEYLWSMHCDIVINLDSDALVRNDFVERLIENYIPNTLLTGFHSTTKGIDGKERHVIIEETENFYIKQSVGGINFCIDKSAYENFVKPALEIPIGNWDYMASQKAGKVYCLKESVIEHIGFESTLGHHDNPDVADNFKQLYIPVTLIGVDNNLERLQKAADICTNDIKFADVQLLNEPITSKEEYSRFCIKELYKYVKTSHLLICQYDGYVNNWKAWDNSWIEYDYIGAPWHYQDGMAVGNGGFSLRSRRLMEIVATDQNIHFLHPEDHHICRTYRPYLENTYGIKFAPIEVAEKFSFEGYMQPHKQLADQFGKHGNRVITNPLKRERYIPNQFLSLGDILFIIPLIRELIAEGNTILWPIDNRYIDIAKHFPDIPFVNKNDYPNLPYESRVMIQTPFGLMLPYRFASENMGRNLRMCMESKYHLYGHNHEIWRNLYWNRDKVKEAELIELVGAKGKFNLVNRTFGHEATMKITPIINNYLPVIEMRNIEGFTLIDWLGIIELATELHISNSSLNYLLELMNLKIPVYIYKRGIWSEQGFEYTRHLFKNECFKYVE